MKRSTDKIIQFLTIIFVSMWFGIVVSAHIPIFPYVIVYLALGFLIIWVLDMIYHILNLRRIVRRLERRTELLYLIFILIFISTALILQVKPIKAMLLILTPKYEQVPIQYVALGLFPALTLLSATFLVLTLTVIIRHYYRNKYRMLREEERGR